MVNGVAVRQSIAAVDDVLATVRVMFPDAATVVLSWSRQYRSLGVMGLLDDDGQPMDVSPGGLFALRAPLRGETPPDLLRIAYPESGLHLSGAVSLNIPVDEPVWARALDTVSGRVDAGLRTSMGDVRDTVWATLEAAGVPSGSVSLRRSAMFESVPGAPVFEPVSVFAFADGRGKSLEWSRVAQAFPLPVIVPRLRSLLNALALDAELSVRDVGERGATVLMDVVVNL